MRSVIRVSLNGRALQLEDDAHALLAQYLESAARTLDGNPDRAEILADLELAVADKSARFLGPSRDVLNREQIASVLDEVGPVEPVANGTAGPAGSTSADADALTTSGAYARSAAGPDAGAGARTTSDAGTTAGAGTTSSEGTTSSGGTTSTPGASASSSPRRRLHQITDGAMIGGVCNGFATWLNVDVTIVRIVAVILAIATGGAAILAYLLLMVILPYSSETGRTGGLPRASRSLVQRLRGQTAEFVRSDEWQRFQTDVRHGWERAQTRVRRGWNARSRAESADSGTSAASTASAGDDADAGSNRSRRSGAMVDSRDVSAPSPLIVLALIALLIAVVALN